MPKPDPVLTATGLYKTPPPGDFTPPIGLKTTVLSVVTGDPSIPAALCAVRYDARLVTPGDPLCGEDPVFCAEYTLMATDRLPLEGGWPQLAARVNRTARRLYDRDKNGDYHILVDASGIGKPVVDAIRNSIIHQVHVTGVTVTTGDKGDLSLLWRNDASIGLAYLVSRLQALFQGRRIHIPAAETALADAIADFTLDAAERAYPVRALALACASDWIPVSYGIDADLIPSPDF